MPGFSFPEYLSANAGRAYPLSEFGARADVTGTVVLPDALLVDARLNVTPGYVLGAGAGTFFVSRVELTATAVTLTLSFLPAAAGSAPRVLAVVSVDPRGTDFGDDAAFQGQDPDAAVTGTLTFGDLPGVLSQLTGGYDFGVTQCALEADVVSVGQPAVTFLELFNGATPVGTFDGALQLIAGRNVFFTRLSPTSVRVDVADGINVTTADACAGALPAGTPIRTINGVAPDANGNFALVGDECITVNTAAGEIDLEDVCSKSCCGCTELASLVTAQQQVEAQVVALQAQLLQYQQSAAAMSANLLAALT